MANRKTLKVKSLVNLKYDKDVKKIGEELRVRIEDVKEMVSRNLVEPLEKVLENNEDEQSANIEDSSNVGE